MKREPRYKKGDLIGGRFQVHQALMGAWASLSARWAVGLSWASSPNIVQTPSDKASLGRG